MLHFIPPTIGIIAYLCYPSTIKINSYILYVFSVFHNIFLTLFSGYSFYKLTGLLYTHGIVFKHYYYFSKEETNTIILLFYLSKYYEFIDTFILYAQNKTPLFLQKYHHIGAVIVWHLCYVYKVDAIVYASFLNSFIHTIMYLYYMCSLLKINMMRVIKPYLTTMQITQFFVGNYICLVNYYPPVETIFNYNIIKLFVTYTCGLIALFVLFFIKTYVK